MSIYAVNGKTPIAAWIPSLDTAGNGTTTLTDLVGSNNGTLTNMDPATDWVADTDAGGVRALGFGGVNDFVLVPHSPSINTSKTWSIWINLRTFPTHSCVFSKANSWGNWSFLVLSSSVWWPTTGSYTDINGITVNNWFHLVATNDGVTAKAYLNGVEKFSLPTSPTITTANDLWIGREQAVGGRWTIDGKIDDFRIWGQALNATDIADLYASGNGRGITFGGTIQTRRRRDLGGFGL